MTKLGLVLYLCLIEVIRSRVLTRKSFSECNPQVDVIFVLDGYSSVSDFVLQKQFLRQILKQNVSPPGAVKVSFLVCEEKERQATEYALTTEKALSLLKNVSTNLSKDKTSKMYTTHDDLCLNRTMEHFKGRTWALSKKIAVNIVGNEMLTNEVFLENFVSDKFDGDIIFVTIVVGIQDPEKLRLLRLLSSSPKYYFVLSDYGELQKLTNEFLEGSCLSFPMINDAKQFDLATTTKSTIKIQDKKTCKPSDVATEYLTKVMFLGWQRQQCPDGFLADIESCTCVESGKEQKTLKIATLQFGKITESVSPKTTMEGKNAIWPSFETNANGSLLSMEQTSASNDSFLENGFLLTDDENVSFTNRFKVQASFSGHDLSTEDPTLKENASAVKKLSKVVTEYNNELSEIDDKKTDVMHRNNHLNTTRGPSILSQEISETNNISVIGKFFNKVITRDNTTEAISFKPHETRRQSTMASIVSASLTLPSPSLRTASTLFPEDRRKDDSARNSTTWKEPDEIATAMPSMDVIRATPRSVLERKAGDSEPDLLPIDLMTTMTTPTLSLSWYKSTRMNTQDEAKGQGAIPIPPTDIDELVSPQTTKSDFVASTTIKYEKNKSLYVHNFGKIKPVLAVPGDPAHLRKNLKSSGSSQISTESTQNIEIRHPFTTQTIDSDTTFKTHNVSETIKNKPYVRIHNFGKIAQENTTIDG